ncbi:MAG TPA: LCP family protein [Fimbriimonadaceae bacterium]|jgi:LCP family protein required for cell wall assembly
MGGFFYGFLCLFLLGIGIGAGWLGQSKVLYLMALNRGKDFLHIPKENPFKDRDTLTLLILGCDEDRYFGGNGREMHAGQITRHQARSDMMLLCRLDFKNKEITGISIPRDTRVAADGHRAQKINGYHVMHDNDVSANNEESKQAVEALLPGVQIDRVMALDFNAFKDMVDIVGGVDMFVPKNMNYDDNRGDLHIHLDKGFQHLDGDKSEQFVRFRHSDDDFHRASRQHDFVLAFKSSLFKNLVKLPQVTDKAVQLTGGALSDDEIAALADFTEKVGNDNIKMNLLPVVDARDDSTDLLLDKRRARSVLRKYHFLDDNRAEGVVADAGQ